MPGYQAVVVLAGLEQGVAEVKRLEPAEHLLEKFYLSPAVSGRRQVHGGDVRHTPPYPLLAENGDGHQGD